MPTATLPQTDKHSSVPLTLAERLSGDFGEADSMLPMPPLRPAPEKNFDVDSTEYQKLTENDIDLLGSAEHREEVGEDAGQLVQCSMEQVPQRSFLPLQQWEGIVTEVTAETVWADLHDLTELSNPVEVADFSRAEISEADQPLVKPGAVFYWSIGYDHSLGGQRRLVSEIRMRRTPKWSQREIELSRARGLEMYKRLNENGEDESTAAR